MSVAILLFTSALFAVIAVLTKKPMRMILAWLVLGLTLSSTFLVLGFEILGVLNAMFVVGSAITLQLFSALFGTRATHEAEMTTSRRHWIEALGSSLVLGSVVAFAISGLPPSERSHEDFSAAALSEVLIARFPELPWVMGISVFLAVLGVATIGRPAWKKTEGRRR